MIRLLYLQGHVWFTVCCNADAKYDVQIRLKYKMNLTKTMKCVKIKDE